MEVVSGRQPTARFQDRPEHLLGGTRVGRGLQHDESARPQVFPDRARGGAHRREVRFTTVGQSGRHAQHDGLRLAEHVRSVGGAEPTREHGRDRVIRQAIDMGSPGVESVDHFIGGVESDCGEACFAGAGCQRGTDVAEPHYDQFNGHRSLQERKRA